MVNDGLNDEALFKLSRLAAVPAAAAFFVSGCYHYLSFHPKMDGSVVIPCRQVSKADRAGYTVAMVERAMRLYDAQGREATVEYYNSPESVDGERYVFIYDENEKLIALVVTPDTLGADLRGDVGVDFTGYRHTGVETFLGGTARWSDLRFRLVSEFAGMDAGGTWGIGVRAR